MALSVVCGKKSVELLSCPALLLTLSIAFAFRHDLQGKNFFFYISDVMRCDFTISVFLRFPILILGFVCTQISIQSIFIITWSALSPYGFVFDNFVSVHYIDYVFMQFRLIQQFQTISSIRFFKYQLFVSWVDQFSQFQLTLLIS